MKKVQILRLKEQIGADQLPVVAFLDQNGVYTGVKFYGIPGGHEMNSFILALYNLAGPGQAIDDKTLNRIKTIDKPVKLKLCILPFPANSVLMYVDMSTHCNIESPC